MLATLLPVFLATLRRTRRSAVRGIAFSVIGAGACCGAAGAAGLTVLTSDDQAASMEFVRLLRDNRAAGSRFDLLRVSTAGQTLPDPAATDDERQVGAARTRGVRTSTSTGTGTGGAAAAVADGNLTVAVGPSAARAAIERAGADPLLLAMLTRLEYESLKAHPALRRAERRVAVLLRDPAMADQLAVVDAVLPGKRRLGIVATLESEPLLRELQRAAAGWELQIEYAPDAQSLAAPLRLLLPRCDALMVLPDGIGDSQAATLVVLRAGAAAGLPVFGASEGLVRSGGLAAAVSSPAQLAAQAQALGQKLSLDGPRNGAGIRVEAATPASVRVNPTVARSLNLRLADERELTERVTAAR